MSSYVCWILFLFIWLRHDALSRNCINFSIMKSKNWLHLKVPLSPTMSSKILNVVDGWNNSNSSTHSRWIKVHYPMNATKCRNTQHHLMELHCIHTYSHHRTIMEVLRYQKPLHYCIPCLHMGHHIVRKCLPESLKTNRVVTLNYMSTTSWLHINKNFYKY